MKNNNGSNINNNGQDHGDGNHHSNCNGNGHNAEVAPIIDIQIPSINFIHEWPV